MSITTITSVRIPDKLRKQAISIAGTSFTNLWAIFFYIGTRALFDIQVHGLHNLSVSPSTIIDMGRAKK